MTSFGGIPFEAVDFYEDLERDNSRDWWLAHRDRYDTAVRAPMAALAAALEPEFGTAKLFRPHRNLRFSADKTPYKTHQGLVVATATRMGWYVQVSADGLMTSAGWYASSPDQLARYRRVLDDEAPAEALETILDDLRAQEYAVGGGRLKTRPRGVPREHPFLELLRHRTLTVRREYGEPEWLPTPEVLDRVAADWRAYQPLIEWLAEHVGDAPA